MRVLACGVEREGIRAGIIFADRGARLDCDGNDAIVDDIDLGDVRGGGESGGGRGLVTKLPVVDRVVRRNFVDLRRAGLRRCCSSR